MKKSKDSRDVFAVFRKGSFMEGATFGEKFKYWMKNVYLYHFGLFTVLGIIAVIFAVTLIGDIINREYNDVDYIIGGDVFIDAEQLQNLSDYMAEFVEAEPDTEVKVSGKLLSTKGREGANTAGFNEFDAANIQKITTSMADDDVLLFFFDEQYAKWYAKEGAFEPLSEFGIESENEYYIRVDELPSMEKYGVIEKDGLYAGIKVKTPSRMKNERIVRKYENAGKALQGLVYGG